MDHKNREVSPNIRAAAAGTAAQTGQDTKTLDPKRKIIAVLICVGIFACSIKAFGGRGLAFAAGFTACGWLVFCLMKGKPKKISAIAAVTLLTLAVMLPAGNAGRTTQAQLMDRLTEVMQPAGYQLVPSDEASDSSYRIYVKDSPNAAPRPNGVRCSIAEEDGCVTSVTLLSANGSQGIPMSAMKFISALNPKWSSRKVTAVITQVLKEGTIHEDGITYTFEDYGTSSRFFICWASQP